MVAKAICDPNLSRNHQASIPKEVFLVSRTNDVVVVARLRERPGDGKKIVEKRVAEAVVDIRPANTKIGLPREPAPSGNFDP